MKNSVFYLFLLFYTMSLSCFNLQAQGLGVSGDTDNNIGLVSFVQFSIIKNKELLYDYQTTESGYSTEINSDKSWGKSLNVILGYFVIPKRLALGVGFGLDGYTEFNSAPLYANARFYLYPERETAYLTVDYGSLVKLGAIFEKGVTAKIGVGYKFFVGENTCLNIELAIATKYVSFTDENYLRSREKLKARGLGLSIAVTLF